MEQHTIKSLLEDSNWLRGICRQLTADETQAEDLLQEGWLHVLRHGGSDVDAPRPWFRRVVRNIRVGGFRAQGPRQDRETAYGEQQLDRNAAAPGPDEVLQRAELRSLIAQAVLDLPEPVRGTLMLRFFEDRSAAQIAEQQGVSAETVRKRIHQGLAQVRLGLERQYPGEKGRLLPALLLAAGPRSESLGTASVPAGKSWAPLALAMMGAACLVAIVAMWALAGEASNDPALLAMAHAEVAQELAQEVRSTGSEAAREVRPAQVVQGPISAPGLLWSVGLQAPIAGVLRDSEGQVVCLAGRGGHFVLPGKWIGQELWASARHHESLVITVPEPILGEPWRVRLQVVVPTTLRIVDEQGKAMGGVPIAVWPWGSGAHTVANPDRWDELGPAFASGKTDGEGMWAVMLGGQAAVKIEVEGGASQYATVQPGVMATLVVSRRSLQVRFVDAKSGEPVVGLLVKTPRRWGVTRRNYLFEQDEFLTGAGGQVNLGFGSKGVDFFVRGRNTTNLSLKKPTDSKWVTIQGKNNKSVFVDTSSTEYELVLLVQDDSLRVHLTDAATGQDLDGHVKYGFNNIWRSPEGQVRGGRRFVWGGHPGRLIHGIFRLNEVRGHPKEVIPCPDHGPSRSEPLRRLVIEAPGYQVAYLTSEELHGGDRLLHVSMQPASQDTHRIRLLWADGSPFWGAVKVFEVDSGRVLGGGRTDALGRLEAMPAPQGAVRLNALSVNEPAGGKVPIGRQGKRHRYVLDVDAAAWDTDGDVIVQLEDVPICGQITVTNVPKGAPEIIASDPMQFEHAPTQIKDGSYVFENLPAGEYVVGPRKWVRALVDQDVYGSEGMGSPLIVMLHPYSKVEKSWRADWFLKEALTGRVTCDAKVLNKAILVARYGSGRSKAATGVQRVNMDAQGYYVIPAGDPRPVGLKLLYGQDRPGLATFRAGRDCKVVTGSIRFRAVGGRDRFDWVTLYTQAVAPAGDRAALDAAKYLLTYNPDATEEFVLDGLPMSIVQVVFTKRDGPILSRTVSMVAGEEVIVEY